MKTSKLKNEIKKIVKQAITERKQSLYESSHSYANSTKKRTNRKLKKESGLTSENANYDENTELELIKQIGQLVLQLLAMHGTTNSTKSFAAASTNDNDDNDDINTSDDISTDDISTDDISTDDNDDRYTNVDSTSDNDGDNDDTNIGDDNSVDDTDIEDDSNSDDDQYKK